MLVYAYWPSYEGREKKYLVFRSVDVLIASALATPRVGVLPIGETRRCMTVGSTTAAVPGKYTSYPTRWGKTPASNQVLSGLQVRLCFVTSLLGASAHQVIGLESSRLDARQLPQVCLYLCAINCDEDDT
jgi:hypothetical protein